MTSALFYKTLRQNFPFEPTLKQDIFFQKISEFATNNNTSEIFILKGYAGTGKTTIISTLVNYLQNVNKKYILLAPTGRAAKVISNYSNKPAFTIHKRIYYPKKNKSGGVSFTLQQNKFKNTIYIVDEYSMIADTNQDAKMYQYGSLLDDLMFYVDSGDNCKMIFIGDTALFACMNRLGPRRSGILFATHALFSVLLAWAFLGEHIEGLALVGGALLVAGVMTAIAFGKPSAPMISTQPPDINSLSDWVACSSEPVSFSNSARLRLPSTMINIERRRGTRPAGREVIASRPAAVLPNNVFLSMSSPTVGGNVGHRVPARLGVSTPVGAISHTDGVCHWAFATLKPNASADPPPVWPCPGCAPRRLRAGAAPTRCCPQTP